MKAAMCEAAPFCAVTQCERQNFLFGCSFKAPMEHFMRSVALQSLSRNFTQTSLLLRCLRFFISLYWRPMAEMTHHKMVAKNFWAWLCFFSVYSAVHIQVPVQVWNKGWSEGDSVCPVSFRAVSDGSAKRSFPLVQPQHSIFSFFTWIFS